MYIAFGQPGNGYLFHISWLSKASFTLAAYICGNYILLNTCREWEFSHEANCQITRMLHVGFGQAVRNMQNLEKPLVRAFSALKRINMCIFFHTLNSKDLIPSLACRREDNLEIPDGFFHFALKSWSIFKQWLLHKSRSCKMRTQ